MIEYFFYAELKPPQHGVIINFSGIVKAENAEKAYKSTLDMAQDFGAQLFKGQIEKEYPLALVTVKNFNRL